MLEDPVIIRLNIRHLEGLLKLKDIEASRTRIMTMLEEARVQLPLAVAEAWEQAAAAQMTC